MSRPYDSVSTCVVGLNSMFETAKMALAGKRRKRPTKAALMGQIQPIKGIVPV